MCLKTQDFFVETGESVLLLCFDCLEPNISLNTFSSVNMLPVTECVVVFPGCSFSFSACSIMPFIVPFCIMAWAEV